MGIIIKPMLADHLDPVIGVKFPVWGSYKYDGIRCIKRESGAFSRKFLMLPNLHIQDSMTFLPEELDGEQMLFNEDGTPKSFQEITSAVMSEDGKPDFRYCVFDYVTDSLKEEYEKRMDKLSALTLPDFCIKVIPKLLKTQDEMDEYEAEALAKGFEGIMIRSLGSPYKCGRATAKQGWLLKVKRFHDSEAVVVGFVEQMSNQNEATVDELGHTKRSKCQDGMVPANTLGKFIAKEIGNTPWKGMEFGCGTGKGLTAEKKQYIWDHRDEFLGKPFVYRYQLIGSKDLPRIPIWHGWRSRIDMGVPKK